MDWNIATAEQQPLNRTGIENITFSGDDVQGTFVGAANPSGASETGLYEADPSPDYDIDGDGTVDGPLKALGVLLPRAIIPEDFSNVPQHPWDDVQEQIYAEDWTLTGDRATFIKYGIEMVNDGTEIGMEPDEPVYLAPDGELTQDPSSLPSGAMVQKVGIGLDPEETGPVDEGRERFLLDVSDTVRTVGGETLTGDGATTVFSIEHNLGRVPTNYGLEDTNANAASADYYVSNVSDTAIELTFTAAPTDGNDLTLDWFAAE
jgi:hypothetical protein